jgi:hypothetical protein
MLSVSRCYIRICPRMSVSASEFNFCVCAVVSKYTNTCIVGQRSQRAIIDFLSSCETCVICCAQCKWTAHRWERLLIFCDRTRLPWNFKSALLANQNSTWTKKVWRYSKYKLPSSNQSILPYLDISESK